MITLHYKTTDGHCKTFTIPENYRVQADGTRDDFRVMILNENGTMVCKDSISPEEYWSIQKQLHEATKRPDIKEAAKVLANSLEYMARR